MKKKSYWIVLVLVLVACAIIFALFNLPKANPPVLTWMNYSMIKSEAECASYGGIWHSWSFWQGEKKQCDMPIPDGGKVCNDSLDCQRGLCLYTEENPVVNQSASGECASWIRESCVNHHYFIENGKIIEQICLE